MASTTVVASLSRMSSDELSKVILSTASSNLDEPTPPPHLAIVDVRDDDHIGGHIKHSMHVPSASLDYKIPELVRKLKDKETVVFHCALSQQRGPSAALRYIRERERLLGASTTLESGSGVGQNMVKNKEEPSSTPAEQEGEWEDVQEPPQKEQKVYVLDKGFVGWQEKFGTDVRLTEGYRKELWRDY